MRIHAVSRTVREQHDDLVAALLEQVLDQQPAHLAVGELHRAVLGADVEFVARSRVHDAIRDLVASGLLHRRGRFVFATRAAVRFRQLSR